jgi:hypothetical protein
MYNTNDAAPAWAPNAGSSRFSPQDDYPISTERGNRDFVTVRGFRAVAGTGGVGGQIVYYYGGSYVVLECNDLTHSPNAGDGASLQYGYAHLQAGGGNGGCTDITIRNNYIHDTYGECIYVGGSEDTGLSAHSNVRVEGNTLYHCGIRHAQGDCIDIKDGMDGVTVRGNVCSFNAPGDNVNGIVMNASNNVVVENNVVHDAQGHGYGTGTFWGTGISGLIVRNNLFFNNAADGIYVGTDTASRPISNVTIASNTIVKNGGAGVLIADGASGAMTNVKITSNLILGNSVGLGGWGDLGCVASYNDLFSNSTLLGGPFSGCTGDPTLLTIDPKLANPSNPVGPDGLFFTEDDGFRPSVCGGGQGGVDIGALPCLK